MNKKQLLRDIDIIIKGLDCENYFRSTDELRRLKQQIITEYPDDPEVFMCEVDGCYNDAEYEGYWRVKDFAGIPTGLIQLRKVCPLHKSLLIGAEKEKATP